jgi:HAD superfamily hydrolase (TIGR01509 family)
VTRPEALLFDFNGTLSDDEPLVCSIFAELFAELGRPLAREEYFESFAGHADDEIVRSWLGDDFPDVDAVVEERIARYLAAAADGSTVAEPVRAAVRYAAERTAVAVVSSAVRTEIDAVLGGAGLADAITAIVSVDDVAERKPHPEPYERALDLLGRPAAAVAFEDTDVGIAAAQAAGLRCVGVATSLPPERLAAAEEVVPALDLPLIRRLLA